MRTLALIIAVLLVASNASGGAYKWVDIEGRTIYSDRPKAGAEKVGPTEPVIEQSSSDAEGKAHRGRELLVDEYESFRIMQPVNDSILDYEDDGVHVSLLIRPGLRPTHAIRLLVDGQEQKQSVQSTQIVLTNLQRGTHQISALVLDSYGQQLIVSPQVVFHLQDAGTTPRTSAVSTNRE